MKAEPTFNPIPLSRITPSKTNPRKSFDEKKLAELAESIGKHGIVQPLLLRVSGSNYEIVAGERRFRAAQRLKLETVPAIVRDLSDRDVLEIQVIENLQREDLDPLEEADGYAKLLRSYRYTADEIAEKIGKSRSYVYARLKLTALCPEARKALESEAISDSIALLVARIPDAKLQREAVKAIADGRRTLSFREAQDYIQREFMLRLADAPWDKKDETLVDGAGPCTTCPMRTGNQPELFGDVKSADVCTSPPCFRKKMDAHAKRQLAAAKERGVRILPKDEAPKVFDRYGHRDLDYSSPYVDVDSPIDYNTKKTYRQALGAKLPAVTVGVSPKSGKVFELIPKKTAESALVAAGVRESYARPADNTYQQRAKAEREKRQLERSIEEAIIAELRPEIAKLDPTLPILRVIGKSFGLSRSSYGMEAIFKARGLKYPDWNGREKAIVALVDKMNAGEIAVMCAELMISFSNLENRSIQERALVRELAKIAGVKADAIEKRIRTEAAEKKKAKAAKARKAAAKKRAAAKKKTAAPAAVDEAEAEEGVCRVCGCTYDDACEGGCAWADETMTLCDRCATPIRK